MKNEKLEQLLKQKAEIEDQIKLIEHEKLNKKWEPVGGEYFISSSSCVCHDETVDTYRLFGTERQTQEQAEKARDKMRVFNRLLAYHDEFCDDYEFEHEKYNWYIHYNYELEKFCCNSVSSCKQLCTIYFPEHIAKELVEKLNSGEVEL